MLHARTVDWSGRLFNTKVQSTGGVFRLKPVKSSTCHPGGFFRSRPFPSGTFACRPTHCIGHRIGASLSGDGSFAWHPCLRDVEGDVPYYELLPASLPPASSTTPPPENPSSIASAAMRYIPAQGGTSRAMSPTTFFMAEALRDNARPQIHAFGKSCVLKKKSRAQGSHACVAPVNAKLQPNKAQFAMRDNGKWQRLLSLKRSRPYDFAFPYMHASGFSMTVFTENCHMKKIVEEEV